MSEIHVPTQQEDWQKAKDILDKLIRFAPYMEPELSLRDVGVLTDARDVCAMREANEWLLNSPDVDRQA